MRVLHHLEKSRSFRILWAMQELGLDYQVKLYKRLPNFSAPVELKSIHPLGKSPILVDDGLVLAESAAILEYLQENYDRHGYFAPKTQQSRLQYRYWMHYAEGSLMPLLVMQLVMTNVPQHVPWVIKPIASRVCDGVKRGFIRPRLKDQIYFIEQHLAENEYFAGPFSFADIQMTFPLEALLTRSKGEYPQIQAFLQRMQQRDAYRQAKQREHQIESEQRIS
ncbi:glutathione S-transferase [Acinetobacter gandensis]|uniref:Glutathione S-transferase n=2 Tax=Acinetobacter TaxID=469 RepID=A0A1A7R8L5_9GAMM|nr:glutathione S-transferase [Acinetobacter gandensis]KAB0625172.1 glutathione S-transferase [Acinetobacter gandensis]OBX28246.1 glutathione S-transferase [Acinetobacter gandensis]